MSYGSYKFYQIIILAVTTKIFVRVTIMEISFSIMSEAFFLFSLFLFLSPSLLIFLINSLQSTMCTSSSDFLHENVIDRLCAKLPPALSRQSVRANSLEDALLPWNFQNPRAAPQRILTNR